MIRRRFEPWRDPDPDPEPEAAAPPELVDDGHLEPSEAPPDEHLEPFEEALEALGDPELEDDPEDAPIPSSEVMYHPDGPYKAQRDELGRVLPGSTVNPETMFRPGHSIHPSRPQASQELDRAPFPAFEVDHAIGQRLRERLDAPQPEAMDYLRLLACRVVDDAVRGRQYAVEAILDRLQPVRAKPRAEAQGEAIVIHTQIVGPSGVEATATVALRTGFEDDDDR